MNQLTTIQYAWAIYFAGSLGCTIAAWWMFLWAWRFVRYAAVVTVMTILFTPYAIDAQTMTMAPAIYSLVFEGMSQGAKAILPLVKLMIGIWLIAIILVAVFVLLTRKQGEGKSKSNDTRSPAKRQSRRVEHHDGRRHENPPRSSTRSLSREEKESREEMLREEPQKGAGAIRDIPIRAIRD